MEAVLPILIAAFEELNCGGSSRNRGVVDQYVYSVKPVQSFSDQVLDLVSRGDITLNGSYDPATCFQFSCRRLQGRQSTLGYDHTSTLKEKTTRNALSDPRPSSSDDYNFVLEFHDLAFSQASRERVTRSPLR